MFFIGALIAVFCVLFYVWLTWYHGHWKKYKIPSLEPQLVFGNIKDFVLMKKCKGLVYDELYRKGNEPVLGIFSMRKPQWLIRDPALYKIITINEFANFKENDVYTEPHDFFLSTNVFFFSGERWKKQRAIVTPALTMSKLKMFLPHMVDITREMIQYLEENQGNKLEAKSFAQMYTLETAMSYVYGIRCNSYKEPNSPYKQVFMELFDPVWWTGFKFTFANIFPAVGHLFHIGLTPKRFYRFYFDVVKETVNYKKNNNVQRKDFLQYLIDSSGKVDVPDLSIDDMLGLTMNVAGDATETSSAGLNSIIDALTRYPEHQAKLRNEIDLKIHSIDDITYENVNSIQYLDAFISESLRILTPIPLLEKKCTNNCVIEYNGKTYEFKKGDKVAYSVYSVHMNHAYFPNPTEFNPDRFLQSDSEQLPFFNFGSGPRMCLGRKLAFIQFKVFLCSLLKLYEILPVGDKTAPIEFEPNSTFFLMIKGGVWFGFKKR